MKINKNYFDMKLINKCMTLSDLKRATGLSSQTLSRIRNDMGYEPNTKTIGKIARALNVDPAELLEEEK